MQRKSVEVINEILKGINNCNTIVFCGAGISRDSGLPIVNQITPYILDNLKVPEEDKELILHRDNSLKIPFEAFIEGMHECSYLDHIFNIYDQGEPNTNHILLAKLIKSGKLNTIVTTNFDKLIEDALNMEPNAMSKGKDYDVLYKTQAYENINWKDGRIRIIKIHGSIDDRENIAITIKQVASHVLSKERKKIIEHIFSNGNHANVLILGYSSSDLFDLSPLIEAISSNHKKVFYIQHSDYPKVEGIQEQTEKNPFKKFTGSLRIHCNTHQLMKRIWESCLDKHVTYELKASEINWKDNVDDWFIHAVKDLTKAVMYMIPAYIFTEMGLAKAALEYYEQALQIAKEHGNKELAGKCLGDIGNAFLGIGDYSKSIIYSEQAKKIAQEVGNKHSEGLWTGNLGVAYAYIGKPEMSKHYYRQAIQLAIECDDKRSQGRYMGNLGNIYSQEGNNEKAKEYSKVALAIAKDIGDKKHEGYWNVNMGSICVHLEEYGKAIEYIKDALKNSTDIGDKRNAGVSYSLLGAIYFTLLEYDKAIENTEIALIISREIGNKVEEGLRLGNLGSIHLSIGKYIKAIEYCKEALNILGSKHHHTKAIEMTLHDAMSKLSIIIP